METVKVRVPLNTIQLGVDSIKDSPVEGEAKGVISEIQEVKHFIAVTKNELALTFKYVSPYPRCRIR